MNENIRKKIDGGKIDWYNPIQNKVSVNGIELDVDEFKQFLFEKGYEGTLHRICTMEDSFNTAVKKLFNPQGS